jgi:hypothetical protein
LLFQTHFATNRIMVSVSDSHIRDALSTPLEHVNYALVVGGYALDASGNFTITHRQETQVGQAGREITPIASDIIFLLCLAYKG